MVYICAINSTELDREDLIKDDLQLHVKWKLSNSFRDLLLRPEMHGNNAELTQIGDITGIDLSPFYNMTYFWEPNALKNKLKLLHYEEDRQNQIKVITELNNGILKNIQLVDMTLNSLFEKVNSIEDLRGEIVLIDDGFFNRNKYFNKKKISVYDNFYDDLYNMREFVDFAKTLDADTVYFKF